jgi:hypothetical protein
MRKIIGDEVANKCTRIWGLDEEKEIRGLWRDLGIPHMWAMMGMSSGSANLIMNLNDLLGNLALCRFYSKHVALRK